MLALFCHTKLLKLALDHFAPTVREPRYSTVKAPGKKKNKKNINYAGLVWIFLDSCFLVSFLQNQAVGVCGGAIV